MHFKHLLLATLGWAAGLAAQTQTEPNAFLLKADTITVNPDKTVVATGHAAVITKIGLRFTAGNIALDKENATVKLSGDVTIHTAEGSTLAVRDLTIDIRNKKLFMLSGGNISIANGPDANLELTSTDFTREFPKSELELRRVERVP